MKKKVWAGRYLIMKPVEYQKTFCIDVAKTTWKIKKLFVMENILQKIPGSNVNSKLLEKYQFS